MKPIEYEKLRAVEDRMWWFQGLHANLLAAFGRNPPLDAGARLMDAGCGTGGFLAKLGAALPAARPIGMDISPIAAAFAQRHTRATLCVGSINQIPIASDSLDAIFSADVLCHRAVDPVRALCDLHRCLKPGGALILNLPAYQWMLSGHDLAVDNARRFTRGGIGRLLAGAGFGQIRISYWNCLLFLPMALHRKFGGGTDTVSDVRPFPAPIEFLFRTTLRFETFLLRRGIALPFGGSILAVAIKHG